MNSSTPRAFRASAAVKTFSYRLALATLIGAAAASPGLAHVTLEKTVSRRGGLQGDLPRRPWLRGLADRLAENPDPRGRDRRKAHAEGRLDAGGRQGFLSAKP